MATLPNISKWLTPYMAAVTAMVARAVGPNPSIADWQAYLDSLLNPQNPQAGPQRQPAPFEPQAIVPQSFQTPYGY